jgi:Zn-dependent M16 (insulinase) family peptidase
MENSDPNKAFSVLFKTTPQDDRGAAHCLEHIVLCGSETYPIRDPFFKMLTRSLNSYMNAWTGSDFTMYPFSTQNHKDYSNLLSVYLDAVFKPLINESDFRQEAWRLEVGEKGLEYKGVVFNEMKGAMADPDSFYLHRLNTHLLAGSPYQHNSGGEPAAIPQLTHADLKSFHSRFYHPSNATFFLYGDVHSEVVMQEIERAVEAFEFRKVDSEIPDVPRRAAPLELSMKCPPSAADVGENVKFGLSYLVHNSSLEPYTTFCM